METNPRITRLLEMLDNPEAYSEQEIRDIILCDDETREAYRLMVEAKQGYFHKQTELSANAETAWQRFEKKHCQKQPSFNWMKMAASFVGILLLSGMAFATIHIVRQHQTLKSHQSMQTTTVTAPARTMSTDTTEADTTTVLPVIYDNIPLENILPEITAHYGIGVTFQNDDARQLRFHFVWNPQQEIEKVVGDLNHFERLHVTLKDNQLIVE